MLGVFQVGLRLDSGLGFQVFVFYLSLGFKAGVRRLIGVFSRSKNFKVLLSSRVSGRGLRLWSCMGWRGVPSSRLSGFTKILT